MGQTIPQSVGDTWTEILDKAGADEKIADNLPKLIASDPRLDDDVAEQGRNTTPNVIVETVEDILDEIDFSEKGIEDPHDVQERMVDTLRLAQSTKDQQTDSFESDEFVELKEIEITSDIDAVTIDQVSEIDGIDRKGELEFTNLKENEVLKLVEPLADKLINKDVAKPHSPIDSQEEDDAIAEYHDEKKDMIQKGLEALQELGKIPEDGGQIDPERKEMSEIVDTQWERGILQELFSESISDFTGESTQIVVFPVSAKRDDFFQEDHPILNIQDSNSDMRLFKQRDSSTCSFWDWNLQPWRNQSKHPTNRFPIFELGNDGRQITFHKYREKAGKKDFAGPVKSNNLGKTVCVFFAYSGPHQNQDLAPLRKYMNIDKCDYMSGAENLLTILINQETSDAVKQKVSVVGRFFSSIRETVNSKISQSPQTQIVHTDERLAGSDSPKYMYYYPQSSTQLDRKNLTEQMVDHEQLLWAQSLILLIAAKHDPHIQKMLIEKADYNNALASWIQDDLHWHFKSGQGDLFREQYIHGTTAPVWKGNRAKSEWIDEELLSHQNFPLRFLVQWAGPSKDWMSTIRLRLSRI